MALTAQTRARALPAAVILAGHIPPRPPDGRSAKRLMSVPISDRSSMPTAATPGMVTSVIDQVVKVGLVRSPPRVHAKTLRSDFTIQRLKSRPGILVPGWS